MTSAPVPFVKGHGTGNDFVILTDLDDTLELSARTVSALCDRRRGIGADGVLVVSRTADHPEVADQADAAPYFMDYRNADGSLAQMCGNGARVFLAHLTDQGLVAGGPIRIATRGGTREVELDPAVGTVRVDMGPARFLDRTDLAVRSRDAAGRSGPPEAWRQAVGVLMPNPHAVTWVADLSEAGSLRQAPEVVPADAYPEGANVEFVQVLGPDHVAMRVHERGVGETLSCGTGACAAAVATLRRAGEGPAGQRVRVDVPGGPLTVVWDPEGDVQLLGPTELVARGTIDAAWWEAHVRG